MARAPHRRALLRSSAPNANSPPPCSAAISRTVSISSSTAAGAPWNSRNSVGSSGSLRPECSLTARIASASIRSQRATGTPTRTMSITARDELADRREAAARGGDPLGHAVDAQLQLGDHRERPLRADDQAGEVVAGGGLARARAGVDHGAVGEHRLEPEHVARACCRSGPSSSPRRRSRPCRRASRRRRGRRRTAARARPARGRAVSRRTPAWTRQSRSSSLIARIRSMRERSSERPPRPRARGPRASCRSRTAITGVRCSWQRRRTAETSSVLSGQATRVGRRRRVGRLVAAVEVAVGGRLREARAEQLREAAASWGSSVIGLTA